jgi:large subunit ribosomal protein L13
MEARKEVIIDAKGAVLGRMASFAAKQALRGNNIVVVNSEQAVITGKLSIVIEDFKKKLRLGHTAQKGPIVSRPPEMICRRAIRGMIAWKSAHGKQIYRNIKCYEGVPRNYESSEKITFKPARGVTLAKISSLV